MCAEVVDNTHKSNQRLVQLCPEHVIAGDRIAVLSENRLVDRNDIPARIVDHVLAPGRSQKLARENRRHTPARADIVQVVVKNIDGADSFENIHQIIERVDRFLGDPRIIARVAFQVRDDRVIRHDEDAHIADPFCFRSQIPADRGKRVEILFRGVITQIVPDEQHVNETEKQKIGAYDK